MRKQVLGLFMALMIAMPASTIIAGPQSPGLAHCDGKHRRPANPYGSILPTVDPQTGTSTPAGQTPGQERVRAGVDVFPGKAPAPPKPAKPAKPTKAGDKAKPVVPPISSALPSNTYQSC